MDNSRETNTCRVCLRSNLRKCKSLLEEFLTSSISMHISSLVQFAISVDDGFPSKICLPCFKQLQTAVEFKYKCESSHAILLSRFTVKQEEEEDHKKQEWPETEQLETTKQENIETIKDKWTKIEETEEYLEDYNTLHGSDDPESIETEKTGLEPAEELEVRPSRAIDLKLECHDCGGIFKSKVKLKVHWKKVHLPIALVCSQCKKKCGNYKSLNLHKKSKTCKILSKATVEGMGKNREFYCKECSYKTKFINNWKNHYKTHSKERPYICGICGISYTQYCTLQQHTESTHKLYKAEGICDICGKYIKGKIKMRTHIRRHKLKCAKCETCGKMLKSKRILEEHMALHSNLKPYTCELCAHTAYTLSGLYGHKRNTHFKNNYSFNCDLCEFKCHEKRKLKRHTENHTASNIPCTVCGIFFECEEQLKKHQQRHFGDRKFKCNFCNKAFLKNKTMYHHIKTVHKIKQDSQTETIKKIQIKLVQRKTIKYQN